MTMLSAMKFIAFFQLQKVSEERWELMLQAMCAEAVFPSPDLPETFDVAQLAKLMGTG